MGDLDFTEISMEQKGVMVPGRMKITENELHFKSRPNGKITTLNDHEVELINWLRLANAWGIRIFMANGTIYRFWGFKESDKEKLGKAFSNRFNKTMTDMDVAVKGWNWGQAKFKGSVLTFDVANSLAFDVPLTYVSQCTTGKNEVTVEFHQNEEARDSSLIELRFHMGSGENAGDTDPVEAFKEEVLSKADVIGAVGDAVAIFREIQCLTPRGRYDIKVYQTFFQLHGKTFDYKIPMTTVTRLFLLPHVDSRQIYFVINLDPPIKQGQTRYHYLVFLFQIEDDCSIELPFTEKELAVKYGGKLDKELSGPTYSVVSKILKVLMDKKITGPGKFISHNNTSQAVGCSYKSATGSLYPLERGFIFVHKPPIHMKFDEIGSVSFVRSGSGTKTFDFEVELRSGLVHTFSNVMKEEYNKLISFVNDKKLRVKANHNEKMVTTDDFDRKYDGGRGEHDAYLARVTAEAEERSDDEMGSESEEDEDYNPDAGKLSDVAEEFDSAPDTTDSEEGSEDDRKAKKLKQSSKSSKESEKSNKKKTSEKKNKRKDAKPKEKSSKTSGKDKETNSEGFKSKEFISDSDSDSD